MDYSFFQCIPMAVFNTATLTGTYAVMNTTGFAEPIKVLKIYNGGSLGITVSYDGTTDHDFYPPGSTFILDLQANHSSESTYGMGELNGSKYQKIYGKGTAGAGNLYIIGYY